MAKFSWALLVSISLAKFSISVLQPAKRFYDTHNYYVIERKAASSASLNDISRALGVEVVEKAGQLHDTWIVRTRKPELGVRDADPEFSDPVLTAFESLRLKASSPITARTDESLDAKKIVSSVNFLELQSPRELVKRAPIPTSTITSESVKEKMHLHDPLFTQQWHLVNDEYPENSMNVTGVWDMGLTGKGVIASFLDDGIDFETDDLKDAFVPELSYDFNAHVPLPRPTGPRDHHGTRCAGQVAARRNGVCGVGIAFESKIAGVRILGGPITTVDEASALNFGFQNVSIYSCSWGPRDDGKTMDAPKYVVRKAVVNGINHGRGGKGSIFVFASGNGGRHGDQCNFDGYTNSIYSVTVGAVDHKGLHPTYSEPCAANMVVAYSSGNGKHIVTTDRRNECSYHHGGTSAAAPNVVGVITLAMEARPDLTWRDVQHLFVNYARRINPEDPDWEKTASGRMFSYKYGYGVVDGYAFVMAAKAWELVKPQAWLHTKPEPLNGGRLEKIDKKTYKYHGGVDIGLSGVEETITITKAQLDEHNLETLEHVDVRVWISHSRRGDVEVEVTSPNGIRSRLAARRWHDHSTSGFPGWRFMSIKHWGENPVGNWTIKVTDQRNPSHTGKFLGWSIALWGSAIDSSKVTKFVEPVIDNALPAVEDPDSPSSTDDHDPSATTLLPKPTDCLPVGHGHDPGDKTKIAFSGPQEDACASDLTKFLHSHKLLLAGFGAMAFVGLGLSYYLWNRRAERPRDHVAYTPLTTDEIQMDTVGRSRDGDGPVNDRGTANDVPRTANVQPQTGRALGFHSGFLDDDEPSAGLTPKYRDEPDDEEEDHPDGPALIQRTSDEEFATPMDSREGSREGSRERLA